MDHVIARVENQVTLSIYRDAKHSVGSYERRDFITNIISLINVINTTKVQEDQKVFILCPLYLHNLPILQNSKHSDNLLVPGMIW